MSLIVRRLPTSEMLKCETYNMPRSSKRGNEVGSDMFREENEAGKADRQDWSRSEWKPGGGEWGTAK